jgi:hypothetical protein
MRSKTEKLNRDYYFKLKFMRKLFFLLGVFTLTTPLGYAQVGIGTDTPDPSAVLEIYSTNKGITLPNTDLFSVTDKSNITDPVNGLLIFNINNEPAKELYTGLYYWNEPAKKWTSILSEEAFSNIMDTYAVEESYVVANETNAQSLNSNYSPLTFSSAGVVLDRENSFKNSTFTVPKNSFYNIQCGMEIGLNDNNNKDNNTSVKIVISNPSGSKKEEVESSVSRNFISGHLSPSVVFTGELKKDDKVQCHGKYNIAQSTQLKYFYVTKF